MEFRRALQIHDRSIQAKKWGLQIKRMKGIHSKKSKYGLREIASAAHVSVATASRVLNGNNRVDPALQKVVLDAATKFGVDLSQLNRIKSLAFLLSNRTMMHMFHYRILLGAEAYCTARGWDMVFLSFNYLAQVPWKELHLPNAVQHRDVCRAVILAGTNSPNLLELLNHKGITHVVLGNNIIGEPRDLKSDAVFSDDINGSQDMTQYLISLGHRRICFVGNTRLPWFARCYEGYHRTMIEAGLEPLQSSIDTEDDTEGGYLGAKSLLTRNEPVSAIIAGNDQAAQGVYKGARDSGLRIPDDISVTGCNDTIGASLYPRLTSVREFPEQIGKQMAEMILNRIADPALPPQSVTIPTELIKRDSCRPLSASEDVTSDAVSARLSNAYGNSGQL
jgi:DNA-binding LacI/PurR family transcriptional regulator